MLLVWGVSLETCRIEWKLGSKITSEQTTVMWKINENKKSVANK